MITAGALITEIITRISELYDWQERKAVTKTVFQLTDEQLTNLSGTYITNDSDRYEIAVTTDGETIVVNIGAFVVDQVFYPEGETAFFAMEGRPLISAKGLMARCCTKLQWFCRCYQS